jgi:hypothetical protein
MEVQVGRIATIIVLSHVDKFVPQNIIELIAIEVRNQFDGQQDIGSPGGFGMPASFLSSHGVVRLSTSAMGARVGLH